MGGVSRRKFIVGLMATAAVAPIARALPESTTLFVDTDIVFDGAAVANMLTISDIMRCKEVMMRNALTDSVFRMVLAPWEVDRLAAPLGLVEGRDFVRQL